MSIRCHSGIAVVLVCTMCVPSPANGQTAGAGFKVPADIDWKQKDAFSEGTRLTAEVFAIKSLPGQKLLGRPRRLRCRPRYAREGDGQPGACSRFPLGAAETGGSGAHVPGSNPARPWRGRLPATRRPRPRKPARRPAPGEANELRS